MTYLFLTKINYLQFYDTLTGHIHLTKYHILKFFIDIKILSKHIHTIIHDFGKTDIFHV